MARRLRLEFPGACYHVINRGNYRTDIFSAEDTKIAFEECLFEACTKWNWLLHAFIVMRNHFHLAMGTPKANLVLGMQWLQATFANRFNRLRREQGHLFQGRYQALLIGGESTLGFVCDYIHLNPVRANLLPLELLQDYRHSSYWYLLCPSVRPDCLNLQTALKAAGLADNPSGWTDYAGHLAKEMANSIKTNRRYVNLRRGWAIGSDAFKAEVISQHAPAGLARAWTVPGAEQMRAAQWEKYLDKILVVLGRSVEEAKAAPKSEPWKLAVATWMRDSARARHNWLSEKLALGTPSVVSRNLVRYRRRIQSTDPYWQRLRSSFST
jgi:REP element-mobilizing transposase RayT